MGKKVDSAYAVYFPSLGEVCLYTKEEWATDIEFWRSDLVNMIDMEKEDISTLSEDEVLDYYWNGEILIDYRNFEEEPDEEEVKH